MENKAIFRMFIPALVFAISLCACGSTVKTEKSATGKISTQIVDQNVKLNHTEYEFPEGYTFEEVNITEPIGMSRIQVSNKEGAVVGVCADGIYNENITEDTMVEAANTVYKTVHNTGTPLTLTKELFLQGENIVVLFVGIEGGSATFIGQKDTPNFSYITQMNEDSEYVMQGFLEAAIKTLGGEADYNMFYGKE